MPELRKVVTPKISKLLRLDVRQYQQLDAIKEATGKSHNAVIMEGLEIAIKQYEKRQEVKA